MAFKMKGWSPFDKKDKESIYDTPTNEKELMNEVYETLDASGKLQDVGGYSAKELAAMTEKERAGNINDYEPGSFDEMVNKTKERLSKYYKLDK